MFILYEIFIDKSIANFKNNLYYIGQHRTNDINDDYMGSGVRLLKIYRKYGKKIARKTILAVVETLDEINTLEKEYISLYKNKYKENCLNIQNGGRNCLDFRVSEEAHKRNIEGLIAYWRNPKNKDRILQRNKKVSESMKGNKNGMGHSCKHSQETRNKISLSVKKSNATRIPKLAVKSSKKVFILKDGKYFSVSNVKDNWKQLGFTSEPVAQRFIRHCTSILKEDRLIDFNKKYNFFAAYIEFDVNIVQSILNS